VSGYAGLELARLLLHHPALQGRPPVFVGRDAEPVRLTDMHPQLADNNGSSGLMVEPFSWELLKQRGVELLFWRHRMSNRGAGCRKRWRTD
jgi:N-acetyl-gamma-glutamyl-phosphate reductase